MSNQKKALRCAVYTRKSSDEGLEQAFNSLDAQREACEAYVLSQRSEGWTLIPDQAGAAAFRLSAGEIEQAILSQVERFLGRTGVLIDELGVGDLQPEALKRLMAQAEALAQELANGGSADQRTLLLDIVERVTVAEGLVTVRLKRPALTARLLGDAAPVLEGAVTIEAPIRLTRRGVETKLVIEADGAPADEREPDPALVKAVARGFAWFEDLVSGRAESVRAIARREGLSPRYVARLLELAFLPPSLVEAILAGTEPADMTAETLTRGERGLVWSVGGVLNAG